MVAKSFGMLRVKLEAAYGQMIGFSNSGRLTSIEHTPTGQLPQEAWEEQMHPWSQVSRLRCHIALAGSYPAMKEILELIRS